MKAAEVTDFMMSANHSFEIWLQAKGANSCMWERKTLVTELLPQKRIRTGLSFQRGDKPEKSNRVRR